MPTLALYQPDIAQNLGTILRLGACLNVPIAVIEPCGFAFDDRKFRRAGMDYIDHVSLTRYDDWEAFSKELPGARRILLSSKAQTSYTDFSYQENDILLLGRETAGVPDEVAQQCDAQVTIPMYGAMRSLNVAISGAMALGEALRQVR